MDLSAHSSTIFHRLSVFLTDRNGLPFLADSLIHQLASKTQLFRSISDDEETLWRNVTSVRCRHQSKLHCPSQTWGADGTAIRAHAPAGFGGVQAESIDGPGVVATNTRIRATSVSSNGRAQSGTGNGINAGSVDGVGVVGNSENGYGVIGTSQSGQGAIGRSGGKGASRDLVVGEHASSH